MTSEKYLINSADRRHDCLKRVDELSGCYLHYQSQVTHEFHPKEADSYGAIRLYLGWQKAGQDQGSQITPPAQDIG